MKDLASKTKLAATLAVVVVLVVVGIINLRDRISSKPIPHDGVRWIDSGNGVQAKEIKPDSPLSLLASPGDYIRDIYFNGKYEQVKHAEDVDLYLGSVGIGNQARYVIEHHDEALQNIYH